MISGLLQIFSNYTRSLEILYLLNDLKESVRLDANEVELKKIRDFCDKENLFLEISDFKVLKIRDEGKGSYANIVKRVPINDSGLYHIYISKNKNKANFLRLVENKNDDEAIGKLLGYPKCCINFFMENKEKQQKLQNDYVLPALENSDGFTFPFYANYAIRYFDTTLLSHFPHSFSCKESIKIAINNLDCIKKYSEEISRKFKNELKSPVLYTEKDGIFIFRGYKLKNNVLEFENILSTTKNELFDLLNQNKKIEIINKNEVKIKDRILENIGFMTFT